MVREWGKDRHRNRKDEVSGGETHTQEARRVYYKELGVGAGILHTAGQEGSVYGTQLDVVQHTAGLGGQVGLPW